MGHKIIFKKRFTNRLSDVLAFLEKEWGKKVADEFIDKIHDAINALKKHPQLGAPSLKIKGARGFSITKHNRLFYRIEMNKIIILSLADTRKKNYSS